MELKLGVFTVAAAVPSFVLIRGVVYPGHEKAPFVASGRSVRGCVPYKPVEDLLQCHECGEWFESLASHLRSGMCGITVAEYKKKHFLRAKTSLINRRLQASLSQKARPLDREGMRRVRQARLLINRRNPVSDLSRSRYEIRNERGTCHAQLVQKVAEIVKEHGDTPAAGVFASRGVHLASLLDAFNVRGIPELLERLGHKRHVCQGPVNSIPDYELLEALRDFYVVRRRLPKQDEWGQGALANESTYRSHFGSLAVAYEKAGLALVYTGRSGMVVPDETIVEALKKFYTTHNRTPLTREFQSAALPFAACTVRNRFGSLLVAMTAAGIDVSEISGLRSQGHWNTRFGPKMITAAFERYCEEHGQPPTAAMIRDGVLGVSAPVVYKHFGTIRPEKLMPMIFADRGQAVA